MGGRIVRRGAYGVGIARYAKPALRLAASAYKAYKGGSHRSNSHAASHVGTGVTSQHDSRTIYRKKRMPRKKKQKWLKFSRKVQAVEEKSKATRSVVFNHQRTLDNSGSLTSQVSDFIPLYSCKSVSTGSAADNDIYSDMNRIVSAEFSTSRSVRRLHIMAGILDVTIAAQTSVTTPTEMDLYYVIFRKDVYHGSWGAFLTEMQSHMPAASGGQTNFGQIGVTPFEFPTFCSAVRIIKKEKIVVTPGQIVTRQWRDPKNRNLYSKDFRHLNQSFLATTPILDQDMFAQRNWTKGFFIVAKGTPTTGSSSRPVKLEVGFTRTYHYKVYEYSADATSYNPVPNAAVGLAG